MFEPRAFIIVCAVGWYSTALAAEILSPDLLTLPWVSIFIAFLISLWGGLISTLHKINRQHEFTSMKLEIVKDILASGAAGFVAFSFGMFQQWNVWIISVALLIAGYGGSKLLDAVLNMWMSKIDRGNTK